MTRSLLSAARRAPTRLGLGVVALLGALAACGGRGTSDALLRLRPPSPHERYAESLRSAGLADAALGRDWLAASDRVLRAPIPVALPYRETGYFDPAQASAVALRVLPRRGQQLSVRVEPAAGTLPFALFVDVFTVRADSATPAEPPRRVASAKPDEQTLTVDVDQTGVAYLVRLQPELLRGGRYTVTVDAGPSLAFPVSGKGSAAVQSFYGAGRDAGRRRHEGVDIFAPRGTPVVAVTNGYITNTGMTELGGKVVWLHDGGRRQSLYYAHLDSQIAHPGQRVRVGDTLGLVGNTGNARTTAPHLHFGVYTRGYGSVDPLPFIDARRADLPPLAADTAALGTLRRVAARGGAGLSTALGGRPTTLPRETVLRVEGASGSLYRVRLPDGREGFVAARLTEPAARGERLAAARVAPPPRSATANGAAADGALVGVVLRAQPAPGAALVDSVPARERLEVLGRYGPYVLVRTEDRREGWVGGTR